MFGINLHLNIKKWNTLPSTDGYTFSIRGNICNNAKFDVNGSVIEWDKSLKSANGFYALVCRHSNRLIAAVDHVRSIPLFYGQTDEVFYLSEDAEWVRQKVGDIKFDPLAREEFQLTGYVTGRDTLFPNVKQLQAGEFLVVEHGPSGFEVNCHRYYRFLHTEPGEYDEFFLRHALEKAAVASVKRLIDYADGRQIVVPLSGGYDSRLIVTLLKKLDYKNILTFTYGVPGNKEAQYSKYVANALGLKWHFVKYSNDLWRDDWNTDEGWQYQQSGSGWSSLAHIQDWLAVKNLKEQEFVNEDCIFVPGHSGDFVAGSHIPDKAFIETSFCKKDVVMSIIDDHYNLAPLGLSKQSKEFWCQHVDRILETTECISTPWQYADAYESWDWQERQAKYICNSVRVYDFFQYDWWMPLWDLEFVKFWESVPLALRKERQWYVEFVKSIFQELSKDNCAINLKNASVPRSKTLKKVFNSLPSKMKFILKNKIKFNHLKNHPHCVLGMLSEDIWKSYYRKGYSQIGVLNSVFLLSAERKI
jgi:asparagine synthase (glutamine-hydrolysing)